MREFAQRLMMQGQMAAPNVATAIFGTAGSEGRALYAGQPALRIGLWPVICDQQPMAAMGLFTVLGLLLDSWQDARVYRLAARVEGEPPGWQWSPAGSQFRVDDWQLDDLDDNVGVWGELQWRADGLELVLYVEDDRLPEDAEPARFRQNAESLSALLAALPEFATRVMHALGADNLRRNRPFYDGPVPARAELVAALEQAFQLELRLFLQQWGQPWPEESVQEALRRHARLAGDLGEFGAWLYAGGLSRWMRFGGEAVDIESAVAPRDALLESGEAACAILAEALFVSGRTARAWELLEKRSQPGATLSLTLADLYRRGGRVAEAVDVLQDAIEDGRVDGELLKYYGDLLQAMELSGLACEVCVLVDPDEEPEDVQIREALAAWEAAERLAPQVAQLLQRLLVTLAEVDGDDPRFWPAFARLAALDDGHEALRNVLNASYGLESLRPGREILQEAFEREADNLERGLVLAELLLLEREDEALTSLLGRLDALAADQASLAELERLRLLLEEPEFEMRLGEIEGVLDAGNAIRSEDSEWLEYILERAPGLGGLHALLARVYLGWGDDGAAMETLLDGYRRFPADAELAALLGEQLWLAGEAELAFDYLGKGLSQNPDDVPLLSLTGQYLLEDGQDDAARACLARAEALAPRHPVLARARARIAAILAE